MTRALEVLASHPGITLQDAGRPGLLAHGISRGGALDPVALAEAAALLGGTDGGCAIEMAGSGGRFRLTGGATIALTGAPMRAEIAGTRLPWPGTTWMEAGATLSIGPAEMGTYGYLSVAGGFAGPERLGARSAHLAAGIGRALEAGDRLPLGPAPSRVDESPAADLTLPQEDRFNGGMLRVLPGAQTAAFGAEALARFTSERWPKDARANRQGVRLVPQGPGLAVEGGLSVTSEAIVPGDIQAVGGGEPFILLAECQTTGGYPRIGTVISADLPHVAQAPAGSLFSFRFVGLDEALAARAEMRAEFAALPHRVLPRVRDPRDIPDLLAYQLVGGVTDGDPIADRTLGPTGAEGPDRKDRP